MVLGLSHTARLAAPPYEEESPTDRVGPALYAIHTAAKDLMDLYSDGYGRELAEKPSFESIGAVQNNLFLLMILLDDRYYQGRVE